MARDEHRAHATPTQQPLDDPGSPVTQVLMPAGSGYGAKLAPVPEAKPGGAVPPAPSVAP